MYDFPNSPAINQVFGNYTWDGEKWKQTSTGISPSSATPLMDGAATAGTSLPYAREDHIHPSNTSRVTKAGDTMTGTLNLAGAPPAIIITPPAGNWAQIVLNAAPGQTNQIASSKSNSTRWSLALGDNVAEGGSNTGSDFSLTAYSDAAGLLGTALYIKRSTLTATVNYLNVVNNNNRWQNDGGLVVSSKGYQPGGGSWADSSDARIKTVNGAYEHGLTEIKQINPVRYSFKNNLNVTAGDEQASPHADVIDREFIGVVAQDIEVVLPETVTQIAGYIDGAPVHDLRIYDSSALIYALINAVKELAARVEALEAMPRHDGAA